MLGNKCKCINLTIIVLIPYMVYDMSLVFQQWIQPLILYVNIAILNNWVIAHF